MKYFFITSFLFCSTISALPPPVPSAGVIERELEKEYEAQPLEQGKEIPSVQIDIPEERLKLPKGECVQIKAIQIRGNESISETEILSWIEDWIGKNVCLREIYELCGTINREYARQGYFLARAYPPPQKIKNGILWLEVVEGKLGTVSVEGNEYYTDHFIKGYFSKLSGRSLQYDDFLRALLLLNENSDLRAAALFVKGEEIGTADVVLRVQDHRPTHLYLNGNNYGRNLTTNTRIGGRLDTNLFMEADYFSVAEVIGFPVNALYFTDVIYRVPLNKNGASLEFAYLFSRFKIEEDLSLRLKGQSMIGTVKGNYALKRTLKMSLDLFSYFDIKQIENYVLGERTSYDKLRVITTGILLDRFATLNGRDYLNVRMGVGIPYLFGALSPVSNQCSRSGAGGLFVKFNVDYDRLQNLPWDCFLMLHGSAQWSPYKLAIPEQVYIGGDDTVRGFPLAVALGDSGYYGKVEFRFPFPALANQWFFVTKKKWKEVFQVVAFLDQGGTFFYGGSDTFLWGAGLGFRLHEFEKWLNLSMSLDIGWPLNHPELASGTMTYIKITGQPF